MNRKTAIILLAVLAIIAGGLFVSCSQKTEKKQLYTCPMHPYYISDKPGDCPICGMKLVPIEQVPGAGAKENNAGTVSKNEMQPDRVVVKIDPDKQQLIDVKTDIVAKRSLGNIVSAVGTVAYDPELYYTQQQYISAFLSLNKAKVSGQESDIAAAKESLDSAVMRLKVMGLTESQVAELNTKTSPDKSLLLSGQGGSAWIYAQVYQDDLKYVKIGDAADITLQSNPGEVFEGKVTAIDPAFNPDTRSIRARILVKNGENIFKPEMYVNVEIKSKAGDFLSVPEEAIMDTGTKQIAFVDKGDGYFEPREVLAGADIGGYYVVKSGLEAGEKVAVNANFMIDSESQLKAAIQPVEKSEARGLTAAASSAAPMSPSMPPGMDMKN
jgi:Cu(I)/Ag(I) efflux system membrane fusion protein